MAIVELKAARGWSLAQATRAFLAQPQTIAARIEPIDEYAPPSLVPRPESCPNRLEGPLAAEKVRDPYAAADGPFGIPRPYP
jgi:predicted RNA polymerase sigma factor